jgi:DNA-directed RNA polymerase specialized sigma24 family protein
MSPLSLRRHRAERLLREEFEGLRERVLASVRGRLRANGASLDQDDLEACYATAWQGLYAAVLDGQEIANPTGWLVLVTFRRAIEEQRDRARVRCGSELTLAGSGELQSERSSKPYGLAALTETAGSPEADFAAELDDRLRLRQLFEGLRGRLDGREREAATLCYLQGLSRSEAAARMGVSDARMRKLMEGRGSGRPGVAGKVGALVASIRDGEWCEEQGSLMRALAYGILDPEGERYQLALMHHGQCPACRAYVVSLRGLAAALPPVLLPWGVAAAALVRAGEGAHTGLVAVKAGGAGGGGSPSAGGAAAGTGGVPGASAPAGAGTLAAAGAGGSGGGWLIGTGGLGAKLAVGCLLALGVGAGCVAFGTGHPARRAAHDHGSRSVAAEKTRVAGAGQGDLVAGAVGSATTEAAAGSSATLTPSVRANREFGPEQTSAVGAVQPAAVGRLASAARLGSPSSEQPAGGSSGAVAGGEESSTASAATSTSRSSSGDSAAATREFSPG